MDENNTPNTAKSSFPIIPVVIVVLVIVGGLFFVMSRNTKTASENTMQPKQQVEHAQTYPSPSETMNMGTSSASPAENTGNVDNITVKGQNFSFTPNEIHVKKGDTVKITFENVGGFHNWVIDEFNAKTKTIPSGQTDTVQFVADKAGTFEYYCSVGNHRQMGMKGNLIVE